MRVCVCVCVRAHNIMTVKLLLSCSAGRGLLNLELLHDFGPQDYAAMRVVSSLNSCIIHYMTSSVVWITD